MSGTRNKQQSISVTDDNGAARIVIDYDDGDRGTVAITEIRLLPSDFPITSKIATTKK